MAMKWRIAIFVSPTINPLSRKSLENPYQLLNGNNYFDMISKDYIKTKMTYLKCKEPF